MSPPGTKALPNHNQIRNEDLDLIGASLGAAFVGCRRVLSPYIVRPSDRETIAVTTLIVVLLFRGFTLPLMILLGLITTLTMGRPTHGSYPLAAMLFTYGQKIFQGLCRFGQWVQTEYRRGRDEPVYLRGQLDHEIAMSKIGTKTTMMTKSDIAKPTAETAGPTAETARPTAAVDLNLNPASGQ